MIDATQHGGLVYLATPYSHDDPSVRHERFRIVNRVAAQLLSEGVHVFSPISHTYPIALAGNLPVTWEFWEEYDRAVLGTCSRLLVLRQEGWTTSVGVTAEIEIAQDFGLPVEFIDVETGE